MFAQGITHQRAKVTDSSGAWDSEQMQNTKLFQDQDTDWQVAKEQLCEQLHVSNKYKCEHRQQANKSVCRSCMHQTSQTFICIACIF